MLVVAEEIRKLLLRNAGLLMVAFSLVVPERLGAQTFTTIYSLPGGSDGMFPSSRVIRSGDTLYGTAAVLVGAQNQGVVFAVGIDGLGYTNLSRFAVATLGDTASEFIISGNVLYATSRSGGSWQRGTVFAINTDGTGFTNLHTFFFADGSNPMGGVILAGETLYGMCFQDGITGNGTIFKINVDGSG